MKVARVYLRVSSETQDLKRQESVIDSAKKAGYYIAGVYRETASGARSDRPELLRLVNDLQAGDVVIAEKMDRISRLPLPEAEALISSIRDRGAILSIPGVVDLSDLIHGADGVSKIVLESVQNMLLKLTLQISRDDYEDRRKRQKQGIELAKKEGKYKGRPKDKSRNKAIIEFRLAGKTITETCTLTGASPSQVKKVWREHKEAKKCD